MNDAVKEMIRTVRSSVEKALEDAAFEKEVALARLNNIQNICEHADLIRHSDTHGYFDVCKDCGWESEWL